MQSKNFAEVIKKQRKNRRFKVIVWLVCSFMFFSCSPSYKEQVIINDAAKGAAVGALAGATIDKPAQGAVIGTGAGGIVGALSTSYEEKLQEEKQKKALIEKQKRILQQQEQRKEDLQRQIYYNEKLKATLEGR